MPLTKVIIENFKSIKKCDINIKELNVLIGENGSGKTNILEAVDYFYANLSMNKKRIDIFDENNRLNNCVRIVLFFDLSGLERISKSLSEELIDLFVDECKTYYNLDLRS